MDRSLYDLSVFGYVEELLRICDSSKTKGCSRHSFPCALRLCTWSYSDLTFRDFDFLAAVMPRSREMAGGP